MASLNKTMVIGNVGKAPELRHTQGNKPVCNFSVAVTESWKDDDGTKREEVTWYNVSAWNKLAEIANQYVKKGMSVYIEGKVKGRAYKNSAGEPAVSLDLTASVIQFLGGGEKQEQQAPPQNSYEGFTEPNEADMSQVPF